MNLVISTGSPNSGWEIALPILQKSGLELAGDNVTLWIDECYQKLATGDLLQMRFPLHPESNKEGLLTALLSKRTSPGVLLADSRNIWLLDFWAQQFPQAKFLLFFTSAESALVHALQQEVEPLQFLESWLATNHQLLQFNRRHRQRTLLLDAEAVCLHPHALEAACRRIGIVLKPTVSSHAPAGSSAMERLLAEHFLVTQPAVQKLQMELEASSQPLGDLVSKMRLQPTELLDSYRQSQANLRRLQQQLEQAQQTLNKQDAEHQVMAQENELLLLQLHQVQEELEHYFVKCQVFSGEPHQEMQARDGETEKSPQRKKVSQVMSGNVAIQSIARLLKKNKERKIIEKQVAWIKASGLFDESWYLSAYPDVVSSGIDPVKHYLCYGAAEGRNPSPGFDTRYYFAANPDIAASGMNPLVHFGKFGRAEGRLPHRTKRARY